MAYPTVRKVAMVSCLVLCVSLLLPRTFLSRGGRQEPGSAPPAPPQGKTSRFPPMMHHQMSPDGRSSGAHFPRSHLAEAVAKAKGGGGGGGGGGSGRGLVGQIIPIYGFGILLYILYILYKLSSKGKTTTVERKSPSPIPGNMNRKITDYELTQLQEKLRETEEAMEKLINRVGPNCDSRAQNVTTDQEKRLLQQLREITRVMKEGKLIDGISPEKEAEEAPYMEDWEECESHDMGQKKDQQISFSDQGGILHHSHNFEKCYCCHYDEDDPAVIAENAGFHADSCSEAEDTAKDDLFMDSDNENAGLKSQKANDPDAVGTLRKRNTKGLE
ncbi:protein RIC-3 isoform X3 [Malaclemys terrapin pileata]|uniref:protein RIC-3 isoform X3 n=1 Tax=Malaclemys terrapin pileata TaxID=2991368 RepID=UPI0023A81726|nr:protein RIC-3 isoform X3 [Malaclemys terrapin pileata]